jgi:hypothetical protein
MGLKIEFRSFSSVLGNEHHNKGAIFPAKLTVKMGKLRL